MPAFETIIVISTKLEEEAVAAPQKRFTDLISENGRVVSVDEWGRRRLAYEIKKEYSGYFVLVNFESPPEFITELERIYRITDGLLRTIVVRKEQTAEPLTEKAEEKAPEETAEPTAEEIAEPVTEETAEPVTEETAEPVAEETSESAAESTAEETSEETAEPVEEQQAE